VITLHTATHPRPAFQRIASVSPPQQVQHRHRKDLDFIDYTAETLDEARRRSGD
jgi:hypothetical protein